MALPQESKILIVGGGCFGISTAYHLLRRGFMDVTVIDRSDILPAKDAASNDFNRIRTSYADHFYSNLAKEAIESWKKDAADLWGDSYHESGVVVLESLGNAPGSFADEAYKNDLKQGIRVRKLENQKEIAQMFPPGTTVSFHECKGYMSYDSGWADAGKAIGLMTSKVASMGGKIIPGKTVKALLRTNGTRTSGVECTDGSVFEADLVVIATGSWTPSTFPGLDLGEKCLATGQCVAMVQLSPEEANAYRRIPVVLAFNTGFYIFPPTESNVMKMAFHRGGYTHSIGGISTPRTLASAENGLAIRKEVLGEFREHFRNTFPELSEKPFSSTRLCW
ncbi:hypothetical protein MPER_05142 [Moniliophthora perniciosa FA553]|nr:hypothetical protein MPER_05142 [Moniliophthora perniciosa FA553]